MKTFGLAGQGFYGTHDIHIPPTFNTPGKAFSANVIVNGRNVHRVGDESEPHTAPSIPPPPPHPEFIVAGDVSVSVFVNERPFAPLGATCTTGCPILLGSYSVFVGR